MTNTLPTSLRDGKPGQQDTNLISNEATCWDCKTKVPYSELVKERRQTSGGGQGDTHVYSGDFTQEWVHADRRLCIKAREESARDERRKRIPQEISSLLTKKLDIEYKIIALETEADSLRLPAD